MAVDACCLETPGVAWNRPKPSRRLASCQTQAAERYIRPSVRPLLDSQVKNMMYLRPSHVHKKICPCGLKFIYQVVGVENISEICCASKTLT